MSRLAIDTETTGVYFHHGCKPFYISTCYINSDGKPVTRSWEWEVNPFTREPLIPEDDRLELQYFIHSFDAYDCWNAKFEANALASIGIHFDLKKADDWFIASHVLNSEGPHDLKGNCFYHLDILDDDQHELKSACTKARTIATRLQFAVASPTHPHYRPLKRAPKSGWWVCEMFMPRAVAIHQKYPDTHPFYSVLARYADQDAERHYAIGRHFERLLEERGHTHLYKRRLALQELTYRMESKPLYLRRRATQKRIVELTRDADHFAREACRISGIQNVASPQQIANYLFKEHKIDPPFLTETGQPSTGKDSLEKIIQDENAPEKVVTFCKHVLRNRIHAKGADYLSQYLRAAVGSNLYHAYNVCGTTTGRLSSQMPNLQNVSTGKSDDFLENFIPDLKKPSLRVAFGPRPKRIWLSCDFQKQQIIGFAYIAKDQYMIDRLAAGEDPHNITARRIYGLAEDQTPDKGQKTIAKNCNFGFLFGASEGKIDRTAKRPGLYAHLRQMMPAAITFMEQIKRQVAETNLVYTPGGYPLVCRKPHKGVNYMVQGHEAEVVQLAMLRTDELLTRLAIQFTRRGVEPGYVAMQVHDEIIFDLPDIPYSYHLIPRIQRVMEDAAKEFGIPGRTSAEVMRHSWAEAEPYVTPVLGA